jgi:hypothetical protein
VAFSCQKRGICPSCAAKRVELFCRFVEEAILLPVIHRQIVFVLPKRLRCFFQGNAPMLTKLNRAMHQSLTLFIRQGFKVDPLRCTACGNDMRITAFVMKTAEIEAILLQMNLPSEETLPRGPPGWFLAQKTQEWINQNQTLYPAEEDLPQEGPSFEDYVRDAIFAD